MCEVQSRRQRVSGCVKECKREGCWPAQSLFLGSARRGTAAVDCGDYDDCRKGQYPVVDAM